MMPTREELLATADSLPVRPVAIEAQWDGDTDWDVGFLSLEPGKMVFFGDQIWFGLRPDQLHWAELDPPKDGGAFVEVRLKMGWHDAHTGHSGILSLAIRDFRNRAEARRKLTDLRARLEAWRGQLAAVPDYWLPLPPVAVPGGTGLPAMVQDSGAFWRYLLICIVLSVVGAVAFAALQVVTGIRVPMPVVIAVTLVTSYLVSMGVEALIRSSRR